MSNAEPEYALQLAVPQLHESASNIPQQLGWEPSTMDMYDLESASTLQ